MANNDNKCNKLPLRMKPATRRAIRIVVAIIVITVGAILLGVIPLNAGFARESIQTAVKDAVGMELSIDQPITLRLGRTPSVSTGGLALGDAAASPLLTVDSLYAKIDLFALLGDRIHVRELSANGIRIDYCSSLPDFSSDAGDDTAPPSIAVDDIEIEGITISCGPKQVTDPQEFHISRIRAAAPLDEQMQLDGEAAIFGLDVTLKVRAGRLDTLLTGPDRFPVDVSLAASNASAEIEGELLTPFAEPAFDSSMSVHVTDVQSVVDTLGVRLPALGSLRADGRFRANLETLELLGFTGELGNSRTSLDTTVDLTGERAHIGLTATIEQLDLAPFLEKSPAMQNPQSGQDDIEFGTLLEVLDAFDSDVKLAIDRVLGAPMEHGAIEVTGSLADGIADIQLQAADLLGGRVTAAGSFDSRSGCPGLKLQARGDGLDLAKLNSLLTLDVRIIGHADAVQVETASCGDSLFAHRDSLQAEIGLVGVRMSLGGEPFPLAVDDLQVMVEPGERSRARLVGKLLGEPINATLAIGSLEALQGPNTWPIDFDARGAGSRLRLNGQAGFPAGQIVLDALLTFEAPRFGTLHPWTAVSPDETLALQSRARLRFDESSLVADAITFSLGRSDLGGSVVWHDTNDPAVFEVKLRSTYLDLDEIGAILPETRDEPERNAMVSDDNTNSPIPAGFTLPPVDLDIEFGAIHGGRLDLQDFEVSGRLRNGLIDDARISVIVEDDVRLSGKLDLDLRPSPSVGALNVAAENVDVGRLLRKLELADDLQLRADGLELAITSKGVTLKQFLLNSLLQADLDGFHWLLPGNAPASGLEPRKAFDLSLSQLTLTAGPDQPARWVSSGQADGVPLELWMETPSLIEIAGDNPDLPITLAAAAGNNVAKFEFLIDRSTENRFFAHILLSGAVIEAENRVLAELESPLADYALRGDVVVTDDGLTLPDLQMRLGNSNAGGSFTLTSSDERRHIAIALHAPSLQTDDLNYWSRSSSEPAPNANGQASDEERADHGNESERGIFLILNDYLAEFRTRNDLDLSITVDELHSGADYLGGAELGLSIGEEDFILKPLSIRLPGGDLDAEYVSKIGGGRLDAELKVHTQAFRYGGMLRLVDPESEARGVLYLDTELGANTEWSRETAAFDHLLMNANGNFSLAAWPQNVNAGILDLWTGNLVLAILPVSTPGEPTKLNCLVARLDVEDGVMQTGTVLLDSTDTIIRGRGEIDLGNQELEFLVAPQAKREKFLSMSTPVMVTGPFDDFQIGIKSGGFLATAMKWWMNLIYVPFKWLTGERFPADGTPTCFNAMDWELTPELHDYFLQRDFSLPPPIPDE